MTKQESQQRVRVNKAFEKINRFDGSDPNYCFSWLEQIHSLINEHPGRDFREELLFSSGGSVSKTIHATDPDATPEQVKDAVLCNHSNLRTVLQRASAYQSIQQKPGEALQTYNTRYASYFKLAYSDLDVNDDYTRMQCTHYATSLYGKLDDEMMGRFNQGTSRQPSRKP